MTQDPNKSKMICSDFYFETCVTTFESNLY
nr:MAG TPA: hypothetical protein [Caudoviricetes sp.]